MMKSVFFMPRTRDQHPSEFREQMVALVRTACRGEGPPREYEPCAAMIHEGVRQAALDDGDDATGLMSEELWHLCRQVTQLRQERDILSKGCPLMAPLV